MLVLGGWRMRLILISCVLVFFFHGIHDFFWYSCHFLSSFFAFAQASPRRFKSRGHYQCYCGQSYQRNNWKLRSVQCSCLLTAGYLAVFLFSTRASQYRTLQKKKTHPSLSKSLSPPFSVFSRSFFFWISPSFLIIFFYLFFSPFFIKKSFRFKFPCKFPLNCHQFFILSFELCLGKLWSWSPLGLSPQCMPAGTLYNTELRAATSLADCPVRRS